VLLVLLRLGSATTLRLAKVADVPRTSTYQVLEDLRAKGLAVQVPGGGAAVWASPGRDEVMDLLDAAEEERLAKHKARTARIRQLIAVSFPESPSVGLPSVQLLASAAQMMAVFQQLLAEAEREFLMFTRPLHLAHRQPHPVVLEALARGIRSRVLYQASEWEDPAAGAFRAEMEVYQRAGLAVRLMEEPPIKLVLVDHEAVLVTMTDPVGADVSYPTTLFVQTPASPRCKPRPSSDIGPLGDGAAGVQPKGGPAIDRCHNVFFSGAGST
jgi:sugar-specific transcriptional regulator TrmB